LKKLFEVLKLELRASHLLGKYAITCSIHTHSPENKIFLKHILVSSLSKANKIERKEVYLNVFKIYHVNG
jgi:hypothetical protein